MIAEKFLLKERGMKALVAYYSETGNTEKLARAIYEGIEAAKKEILPINGVKNAENYDIIFCGFPIQSHSLPVKVEVFLKSIPAGQKLAFFATHGSYRGGEFAIQAFHYALSLTPKHTILGSFGCRGRVTKSRIDALMDQAEHRAWAIEAQSANGHPNEADFEEAKVWARAMLAKAYRH